MDPVNDYFPYPDVEARIQSLYDDIILSMFSNPLYAVVVCEFLPVLLKLESRKPSFTFEIDPQLPAPAQISKYALSQPSFSHHPSSAYIH